MRGWVARYLAGVWAWASELSHPPSAALSVAAGLRRRTTGRRSLGSLHSRGACAICGAAWNQSMRRTGCSLPVGFEEQMCTRKLSLMTNIEERLTVPCPGEFKILIITPRNDLSVLINSTCVQAESPRYNVFLWWLGKCLKNNLRLSSGAWARLSFHCRTSLLAASRQTVGHGYDSPNIVSNRVTRSNRILTFVWRSPVKPNFIPGHVQRYPEPSQAQAYAAPSRGAPNISIVVDTPQLEDAGKVDYNPPPPAFQIGESGARQGFGK
ncbi:hypothetical protein GGX14DRAFT_404613 [Mycena pura]|uniref:Uncharacterized protein n=1 Tax=Mycena pura TaxID=153505 RepID=A0AAD6Y002_9AGAR|nr:hypothetical protein GGX14DRAFT_404613 [Mycena pura]